MKNRVFMW